MRWLTATACVLALALVCFGQQYICGPNGCRIVYTPTVFQQPVKVVAPKKKSPECNCKECKCENCTCTIAKEVEKQMTYTGPLPTGVVPPGPAMKERFTFRGLEVDRKKIEAILGAYELVDDSKKATVTVIGPDKDRKEVVAGLKAKLGTDYKYWEGPASDWSFEPGFSAKGDPVTIYCQAPDGKVLYRQDNGAVETAVEAIRKANPAYDPKKDPDGKATTIPTSTPLLIAAAVVAFLILGKGKQ